MVRGSLGNRPYSAGMATPRTSPETFPAALAASLPDAERQAASRNAIELVYGVGGESKADSSTRIQAELEA